MWQYGQTDGQAEIINSFKFCRNVLKNLKVLKSAKSLLLFLYEKQINSKFISLQYIFIHIFNHLQLLFFSVQVL